MGDAGTMSVAASNNLTTSGVQAVTGAKTFNNQKLVLRNPADTFSLTLTNPAITANSDLILFETYTFYVTKVSTTYYVKSGGLGGVTVHSGSSAATEIQWAIDNVPSEGGLVLLAPNTTFDLGSPSANGLTLEENKTKHVDLLGSGLSTIIQYTGTGAAITAVNTLAATSYTEFRIGNFTLTGVASPYSSGSTTVTSGRNGIYINTTYGRCEIDHIWLRQFDKGIEIKNTEFCDVHNITAKICNSAIVTSGVLATNTDSGIHIHDCSIAAMFQYGISINSGGTTNFEQASIDHCVIDDCITGIKVESYGNELTIADCYIESILAADEATWGGETVNHIYLAGSASFPLENVVLRNLHLGGVENTDNAIKVESCKDLTLDHCDAKGFRNAMVLINTNNTVTYLTIRNPKLRAYPNITNVVTPYLVDTPSDTFLASTDARLVGTVYTDRAIGNIVSCLTAGLVAGDVVKFHTATAATIISTSTADDLRPAVVMYPGKLNRSAVIVRNGFHNVNMDAGTTFGDTITTSATTKKGRVNNNAVDPKLVLGHSAGFVASAGLVYVQIK